MRSRTKAALLPALFVGLAACGQAPEAETGSDTNWLSCQSSEECGEAGACKCGTCTWGCRSSADCASLPGPALCLEASEVSERDCRIGFASAHAGICTATCGRNDDCPSGQRCAAGACLPERALTPNGRVDELPVVDGQVSFTPEADPEDFRDAGGPDQTGRDAAPSADGPTNDAGSPEQRDAAPSRDGATHDGSAGDAQADAEAKTGTLGPALAGWDSVYGYDGQQPTPTCPCETSLSPQTLAPVPGDLERNAYGSRRNGGSSTPRDDCGSWRAGSIGFKSTTTIEDG